ncbi:hypothetical protein AURDEDRAFT_109936 [Auricularia subglabra TFB-10046 SS5]|nr:hypothetical protein AURDEDRAFT_109936 [Auricularia subglabra TFB-10046 SS5]
MAGLAGGAAVLVGGYTAYHFSDLKKMVDAAQAAKSTALQARDKVAALVSNTRPSEALKSLRSLAESYVSLIPGAGSQFDRTFDELDRIAEKHGDKATAIAKKAYDEIQSIASKGQMDMETAGKVADVLRKRIGELQALAGEVGGDILDAHPEVKQKLGGGYEQLQRMVEQKGPEARKAFEDVQKQLKDILANGPSPDALDRARKLLESRTRDLRNAMSPAAQQAWDASMEKAKPYLNKLGSDAGSLRELLTSNAGALSAGSKELFDRVKRVSEAKGGEREKQVKELKEYVEQKAGEAGDSVPGLGDVMGWVKQVPGGETLLQKVPNAEALQRLAEERGEEAEKLAKETWDELIDVLRKKSERAKELVEDAKEDAKDASKSK